MKYALVNSAGRVTGLIAYDGKAAYLPPAGLSLVSVNDWVKPGDRYDAADPATLVTDEQKRAIKAQAVRDKRDELAYGGFTLNGMFIRTDTETRGVLDAMRVKALENIAARMADNSVPALVIDYDGEDGYVEIDAATAVALADAAFAYVQKCFSIAKAVIDAADDYAGASEIVAAYVEGMAA